VKSSTSKVVIKLRFEPRSIPVTTRKLLFDNRWGAM
jgi:hypothetical protein